MTDPAKEEVHRFPWLGRKLAWLDDPRHVRRLFQILIVICVGLALADFLYHKHVRYAVEELPAIYGVFGFIAYVTVITLAKGLRRIVRRPEDYYAPYSVDPEDERAAGSDPAAKGPRDA